MFAGMWRLLFLLCFASPAMADDASYARAFSAGDYGIAAGIVEAEPGAEAKALTARALLAGVMSGEGEPDIETVERAMVYAQEAVALEPAHIEGRLQLAIAISLYLRPLSTGEARRTGLSGQPKELAEAVLVDDPANAYAHGLLAVWNVEVVRRGGRLGAAIMGAGLRSAKAHYEAAAAASPDDASVHWQYARALAARGAGRKEAQIRAILQEGIGAKADDALEAVMQARCAALLTVLDAEGAEAATEAALSMH